MLCVLGNTLQDHKMEKEDMKPMADDSYLYASVHKADKTIPKTGEMKGTIVYTSVVFDNDSSESNNDKAQSKLKKDDSTAYATVAFDNNIKPVVKHENQDVSSDGDETDDSNPYESVFIEVAKNDKNGKTAKTDNNGKTKVSPKMNNKFKAGSFDGDLPPTPPEEWETSNDRLGGKLYVAVKNFKARYPYEIDVKLGEMVELTEIDPDDKSWHVRVTLGTSLDGYMYTKRVGWVPYDVFADYEGPDNRKSLELKDVSIISQEDTCPLPEISERLAELDMMSRGTSMYNHLGHRFQASSVHIPIKCAFCDKWCLFNDQEACEYQCLNCKLVVHKGCHSKILNRCQLDSTSGEAYCPIYNESDEHLCIDLPHRFLVHTWRKVPPRCSHCSGFIIGMVRQGLKCAECGTNIHHKCKPNVANTCSKKCKGVADQVCEVKA